MKWLKRNWYWLLFGAVALLTVYMDVFVARYLLDGDTSDYVQRGWRMVQEKDFFLSNYYRTTELRLFDLPMVYALFFLFTDNWTLVRILSSMLMQALYVLSFLYMGRQAGIQKPARVISATLLLLPFSTAYARIVLYHSFYILYLSAAFLLAGLTLHTLRLWQDRQRRALIPGILLGLLWLVEGTNGVRHMMIIGAPMLLFGFIRLIRAMNEYGWSKPLFRSDAFRLCLILLGSCLCFLAGYAIYPQLAAQFQIEVTEMKPFTPTVPPELFTKVLNDWLIAIGVRFSRKPLLSLRGVALLAALFAAVYGLVRSFAKGEEATGKGMLRSLLGLSTVISTGIFLLEGETRFYELYYVPVLAMIFPLLAVELDTTKAMGQKTLCLLCCLCLAFSGGYTARFMLTRDETMDQWTALSHSEMDTVEVLQECVAFMQEEEYTHALIDYWYANPMIELSNGQLTVAPLELTYAGSDEEESLISIYPWGTSKTAFLPENLPDTVLVFLRWEDELPTFLEYFPDDAELVWEGYPFSACEIPSDLLTLP